MQNIQNCYYRISAKALIFNKKRQFLLCKESNGVWDLPGGGLDHFENPDTCIRRELQEEMGLNVIKIYNNPMYFVSANKPESITRPWIANVCYRVEVENLDFKESDECVEIGFFSPEDIKNLNVLVNVRELVKQMLL